VTDGPSDISIGDRGDISIGDLHRRTETQDLCKGFELLIQKDFSFA